MNATYYRDFFNLLRELTIRAVESMPVEQLDFQPSNSRSFREIVLHIVGSQYFILNAAAGREDKPARELTAGNYPTREALVDLLRAEQRRAVEVLEGLDEATLARTIKTPFGTDEPAETMLHILLIHETDHKGGLVMMTKVNGADPPDVMRLRKEMEAATTSA